MDTMVDVSVEEARKLSAISMVVNRRYEGRFGDPKTLSQMIRELKDRIAEVGFKADITLRQNPNGYYIPVVDIVERIDAHEQAIKDAEGIDLEHRSWEASRVTSSQLKKEGVDTDLLMG